MAGVIVGLIVAASLSAMCILPALTGSMLAGNDALSVDLLLFAFPAIILVVLVIAATNQIAARFVKSDTDTSGDIFMARMRIGKDLGASAEQEFISAVAYCPDAANNDGRYAYRPGQNERTAQAKADELYQRRGKRAPRLMDEKIK